MLASYCMTLKSHVDDRYKRGLLKPMLDRGFRFSVFQLVLPFRLRMRSLKVIVFSTKIDKLVNSTITRFIAFKAYNQPASSPSDTDGSDPVRAVLPFKRH